ncbi:hypothetical protein SAMN02746009_01062 [Hymenobacter psychrotolerans DSM 18569]|uniref:Uncharacterized protein n=1 Tax=Hymenobacter psychrotolerans DSM 18569 TaxID=1121959 RepID=A0A1M6T2U7_9BACT|nr:hypothetical protein SAMN02746009_01062 [Hymenobacter psychrotolerans DSM 18569]
MYTQQETNAYKLLENPNADERGIGNPTQPCIFVANGSSLPSNAGGCVPHLPC